MAKKRKSIEMFDHERAAFVKLYLERRIPIGQYGGARASELKPLCDEWRGLTGRTDSDGDLLHYMRNERKSKRWPKLNGDHLRKPKTPEMSADDVETLRDVYDDFVVAFGIGSENIAYDDDKKAFIVREFSLRAGHVLPFEVLMARLTELRKRGRLTRVSDVPPPAERDDDTDFNDIEAV